MKVEIKNNNHIYFFHAYECKDYLKAIGARYAPRLKRWSWRIDIDGMEQLKEMTQFSSELAEVYERIKHLTPSLQRVEGRNVSDDGAPFAINNLYEHQKKSVWKARKCNAFADLSDPGTGKTRVQINMLLERNGFPALIICPKSIMEAVWKTQLEEVTNDLYIQLLNQSSTKDCQLLELFFKNRYIKDAIFIVNYDKVPLIIDKLLKVKWKTIIADESSQLKNPQAKRSKAIISLRDIAKYRTIMTGTPAPNSLLDIFNQYRFLDPAMFGENYYAFRARWFEDRLAATRATFPDWVPKLNTFSVFKERMESISVQHKKRKCLDLPPLVQEDRFVDMSNEQKRIYTEMKTHLIAWIYGEEFTVNQLPAKLMKLRQIADGFIYTDSEVKWISNSKINELVNLLDSIGNQQVIIFSHFTAAIDKIVSKLKCVRLDGSVNDKDRRAALEQFKSGEAQYLVGNPAAMAHGLNLQHCSNIIYYDHDFNLETFLQSIQRIERIGQENKMTVYHLLSRQTIEKYILTKLRAKDDIQKRLDISELKRSL